MIFDVSDEAYDRFMGRYSVRLASVFADFAGIEAGGQVLDVGAGTGALTAELMRRAGAGNVAAVEPSERFVAALHRRFPELDVRHSPAEELPWPEETFDAAAAQLVVSFMNDAPAAARELRRVLRPGGTAAVCMWAAQGVDMFVALYGAGSAAAPDNPPPEQTMRYRTEEENRDLLANAGLEAVDTALLEVESAYTDFEDFWDAALGGVGPAGSWLLSLDESVRSAVREETYRRLDRPTGAFTLRGRAWAARARRSSRRA